MEAVAYDELLKPLLEQDKLRRKTVVLATRIVSPAAVKAFHLQTLDGKYVDSESLKGQAIVSDELLGDVVFVPGCELRMEKLYQSYRNDPSVVIVAGCLTQKTKWWLALLTGRKTIRAIPADPTELQCPWCEEANTASSQGVDYFAAYLVPRYGSGCLSRIRRDTAITFAEEFSWKIEAMRRAVNGKDTADALARQ